MHNIQPPQVAHEKQAQANAEHVKELQQEKGFRKHMRRTILTFMTMVYNDTFIIIVIIRNK